jgi:hypothetical protein
MIPVEISASTYHQIEKLSRPFKDKTPEDVIRRALDVLSQNGSIEISNSVRHNIEPTKHSSDELERSLRPDLSHTHITDASFAGHNAINWNALVKMAHRVALKKLAVAQDWRIREVRFYAT